MKKMEPASLNVHVHVVSQPGGAVPVLYTARSALASGLSPLSRHSALKFNMLLAAIHSLHTPLVIFISFEAAWPVVYAGSTIC